ncbi:taste receptor type 2 member 8 [Mirounga leonina]|uniref:taste receptor type 2 member 8 n=1 Tax=Mirounga leonina TaxID=9715 RepID=UPI00156BFAAD|nr:taste receptor type 2 member 8 [Mirounga leonina]
MEKKHSGEILPRVKYNLSTEDNIFVIIVTGEFIIGMLGNVYIGLVNWIDWIKKKKISSIDYILTSLAISRICLLCVLILNGIIMIANFSHPLFLWLKRRTDRVIHWILLATTPNYDYEFHKIINHKRNCTEMFHVSKSQYFNPLTLFNLLAIVPCTVSLISFFLLIMSLWRHIKQMKLSVTGCGDPSTEAHVRAMKTMTSFLFLLFVYYGASLLATFSYPMKESKLAVMLGEITAILYPSGHSLLLIIRNNKLRQTYIRMLRYGRTVCMM